MNQDQNALARDLLRRQESLAAERATLDQLWQEIAELMQPMRADFTLQRQAGEKRSQKIFDGTAGQAAENLAAGLWGLITNAGNDWFTLRADLPEDEEDQATKLWLDEVTRRMRAAFAGNGQRFYARVMELYADLVTFGTAVFYVEEDAATGKVHYSCRHLAECFIAENAQDEIDTLFRRFRFSARQAVGRWGDACHPAIRRAVEKEPDRRFSFLHAVMPRGKTSGSGTGPNMPFVSHYVDVEHGILLSTGGYHEFPYQVPRWSTASRGLYGDSPAMMALPDVKLLNAMSKTTIIAAQKAVDPPLLAIDELAVRGLRTHPGGIIYGGLDENGRRRYEPLSSGGNVGLGLELEEQRRETVRQAFYFSLLLMVQQPNQTATEVLARQEEKLRLMGPHLGRIQAEFLDPLIRRQFGIMRRANLLPPTPRQLQGSGIRVEYVSPLARAQRAGEGAAIVRALESLAPIGAIKPEIYDNIDADAAARALVQSFGAPNVLLRTATAVAEMRAAAVPPVGEAPMAGGDPMAGLAAMLGGGAV